MLRRLHLGLLKVFRLLPRRARRTVVRGLAPSFTVGAICVIEREGGELLLVRQSYRTHWGFPGGLTKRGEDIRDTARREALEEVRFDIELVGEPAVVVEPRPRRVDVVFRARPAPGAMIDDIRPVSPEILEARWFPAAALPELQEEAANALVALARATTAEQGQRSLLPPAG